MVEAVPIVLQWPADGAEARAVSKNSSSSIDGRDVHGRGGHYRRRRRLVTACRKHHGVDKVTVEDLDEPEIREVAV
jgi:hypothetical protein